MHILDDIAQRKAVNEATGRMIFEPTIYAGRLQMIELRKLFERVPTLTTTGEVGGIKVMGMPLIEVVADDYLRVT